MMWLTWKGFQSLFRQYKTRGWHWLMEKNDLKMNQNSSSLMLAGPQKWKNAQMSEKTWIKWFPNLSRYLNKSLLTPNCAKLSKMSEFAAHAPLILQKDSHEVLTRTNRDQRALQLSSRDILQLRHSNTDSFHHLWPVPVCEGPLVYLRGALLQPFMSETCLAFQTAGSLCAWLGGAKIQPSQILVYLRLGAKAQRRAPEARAFHIVILVLFTGFRSVCFIQIS